MGGVPITYKTAAALNKLNVHPHTTNKLKMSPSNTKRFKNDVLKEMTAYLLGWDAAGNTQMLLQQFQAQMRAGASGGGGEIHPIHHFPVLNLNNI